MEEQYWYESLESHDLAKAVDRLLIGGNSIASALLTALGDDVFTKWQSHHEAHEAIKARMRLLPDSVSYVVYEMWLMWFGCMQVRGELDKALASAGEPSAEQATQGEK